MSEKLYRIRCIERSAHENSWILEYRFGDMWVNHTPRHEDPSHKWLPGELMGHIEASAGMDKGAEFVIHVNRKGRV